MLAILFNWQRLHGSLNGNPPVSLVPILSQKTPIRRSLKHYDPAKDRLQDASITSTNDVYESYTIKRLQRIPHRRNFLLSIDEAILHQP
jgi:hypothetical protein